MLGGKILGFRLVIPADFWGKGVNRRGQTLFVPFAGDRHFSFLHIMVVFPLTQLLDLEKTKALFNPPLSKPNKHNGGLKSNFPSSPPYSFSTQTTVNQGQHKQPELP